MWKFWKWQVQFTLRLEKQIKQRQYPCVRPSSDAELFIELNLIRIRPTQILMIGWIDSDTDLNPSQTNSKGENCSFWSNCLQNMLNNLCLRSEIKPSKSKPFQKCSKVEILGRAMQEEQLSQSKLKKALIQMPNLSYLILKLINNS